MYNKLTIVGYLGADPEVRYTTSGTAVCNFRVATSERWVKDGETQEHTEWHRIVVWGKSGENAEKYLRKGSLVLCEGQLRTRPWEDRDGATRYTTEVIVNLWKKLSRDSDGDGGKEADRQSPDARARDRAGRGRPGQQNDRNGRRGYSEDPPPLDVNDIPF
jgi:single-strand DNA-binding protein